MSESEPHGGYRISRKLEAVDREIRRQKRHHAGEEEDFLFAPGTDRGDRNAGSRPGGMDAAELVRRFQNAPVSTPARLLLFDGVSLPCPETLDNGEEIRAKLWEVIDALARRRIYLHHTNHLTNRELYSALWVVHLNEGTRDLSDCPGSACHIDLLACRTGNRNEIFIRNSVERDEVRFGSREGGGCSSAFASEARYDRDRCLPGQSTW